MAGPPVGVDPLPRPQGARRGARARSRAPSGRRRRRAPPADDGGVYDKNAAEPPSSNSRVPPPLRSTAPPRSPTAPPVPPDAPSLIAPPAEGGSDNDAVRRWSARLDDRARRGTPPTVGTTPPARMRSCGRRWPRTRPPSTRRRGAKGTRRGGRGGPLPAPRCCCGCGGGRAGGSGGGQMRRGCGSGGGSRGGSVGAPYRDCALQGGGGGGRGSGGGGGGGAAGVGAVPPALVAPASSAARVVTRTLTSSVPGTGLSYRSMPPVPEAVSPEK